ncbi:uncharacterized protein LOC133206073 [Saccostrea echinata]|uniref:uncharacterized protein LOC133206073 n=1 Tax=Saccostrea echinata TaxID=191078 RepID=UPI002A7F32E2|nr:uncharacterized protein LOC133206073 [Saccostrea echinata]
MLMMFIFLAPSKAEDIKSNEVTSDEDSSEEINKLWRKYGELKADVDALKAKHQKDEMGSSCEDSSEESEENGKSGDGKDNKDQEEDALKRQFFENIIGHQNDTIEVKDEEGFSTFPLEVTSVQISRTVTEYRACTAQIEAPARTYFVCSWTDLMDDITPVSLLAINGNSTIPFPKLFRDDGKYNVTCYTTASFLFMTAYIDQRKSVSVVCDMRTEGTSSDFEAMSMKYKTNERMVENEVTKTQVDFKLLQKAGENGEDIDYSSTLYWINGSVYLRDRDRNPEEKINFIKSASSDSITRVTFETKTNNVANLRGNMNVFMSVRPTNQMSHGIRYRMGIPPENSLIDVNLKGELAFKETTSSTFLYGKVGSVTCRVVGNPLPYIEILKNKGNQQEKLNLSYTYFNGIYLTASKVWEKVDNDVAGNYTCKAISDQEILQTTFRIYVAPVALIENTVIIKNGSIVTVTIEASSSGNGDIVILCTEENSEGILLLSERYYQDVHKYEGNEDTLTSKLEYYRPMVIGFSKNQRTSSENTTQMTYTIVLDSTMEVNPPSQIACTTLDPAVSIPVKWLLVSLNITSKKS